MGTTEQRNQRTLDDHDAISNTSADPSRATHAESKVRQYLEKGSKSSSSAQGGQRMHKLGESSGPLVKVNYNHSCDLERLEKFRIII